MPAKNETRLHLNIGRIRAKSYGENPFCKLKLEVQLMMSRGATDLVNIGTRMFYIEVRIIMSYRCIQKFTRGKEKIEQLPCERFLQGFEFSRAFLPPVSHGVKRGKFQKHVKISHKAVVLIFLSL